MDRAYQAILIAGKEDKEKVIKGKLKATIRLGHRDYTPGPVMIGCHIIDWARLFTIKKVNHTTLKNLTLNEIFRSGYKSQAEMLKHLKKYYPGITIDSPTTFIEWE